MKDARRAATGSTALTGAKACKCKSEPCNITHHVPISTTTYINSTYKHPPAQGEIVGAGAGGGVNGAKAAATSSKMWRSEMRADNIHMISTYGHKGNCWKMCDRSRVGTVVRSDSIIGIIEPFDSRDSGVRELEIVGRFDSRESRVKESGSESEGSRVRESGIAGKT